MCTRCDLEPAITLALWFNAAKAGLVSQSDAANASESVTGYLEITRINSRLAWLEIVQLVCNRSAPVVATLPKFGNLSGIPASLLTEIDLTPGVVAIDNETLITFSESSEPLLFSVDHQVPFPDLVHVRQEFAQSLVLAEDVLSNLDLVGSRDEIDSALESLNTHHIPPIDRSRDRRDLDSAIRIRFAVELATGQSMAISSRSQDVRRLEVLTTVKDAANNLIVAISSKIPS